MKATITMNGVTYHGDNIAMINNKIFVDGKDVTPETMQVSINVVGDVEKISADMCAMIHVTGNCGFIKTASGDVDVGGDVTGSVSTMSGDVTCKNVGGNVQTMSGDITRE